MIWGMALGCVIRVEQWSHWTDTGDSGRWAPAAEAVGANELRNRGVYGYERATLSIEHGQVVDDHAVRNDWDLLFGNDSDPDVDWFTVNTVADDRSFLVDLGRVTDPAEIPLTLDPADQPVGPFGRPDDLVVHPGHSYLVRTLDDDTRQWALVEVLSHTLGDRVEVRWCRSDNPDLFVAPVGCF